MSYQKIFRCRILVDQIRIEDIKLVTLHDLRRRIVHVVMRLIVLVPFETGVHAVEITRLTRSVFVGPQVDLRLQRRFDAELRLVRMHSLARFSMHGLLFGCHHVLNLPTGVQHFLSRVFQSLIVVVLLRDERARFKL